MLAKTSVIGPKVVIADATTIPVGVIAATVEGNRTALTVLVARVTKIRSWQVI